VADPHEDAVCDVRYPTLTATRSGATAGVIGTGRAGLTDERERLSVCVCLARVEWSVQN